MGISVSMSNVPLTFVTGNAGKLREFIKIMGNVDVVSNKVDLPELQEDPDDISREKCKLAAEAVKGPVCVEDTCLCFNALNGLPGPYIKWFLDGVGHEGLNKMLAGFEDKTAYALCTFSYTAGPGEEIFVFRGETPGTIVPARGPNTFGWDPIFLPDGFDKTYAEMDSDTKNTISHRGRALEKLKKYFTDNQLHSKQCDATKEVPQSE